jgi:hypothetical protein
MLSCGSLPHSQQQILCVSADWVVGTSHREPPAGGGTEGQTASDIDSFEPQRSEDNGTDERPSTGDQALFHGTQEEFFVGVKMVPGD